MSFHELLRHLPVASAVAWFLIAGFQVYRDRYHTWTETFFLASCFFAGFYALSDWYFFNVNSPSAAFSAAIASMTNISLTVLFFLLFTLVYIGRMRRLYWAFGAVTGGVVLAILLGMVQGVERPDPEGLFVAKFDSGLFGLFLVYVVAYAVGGVVNLYRLNRIVREQSPELATRTRGLLVVFTVVLALGVGTNGYLGITQNTQTPPPFSTLLLFTGVATMYTLYPGARHRIAEVIRRFQASRYTIKAAFLIFQDGTLIASKVRPGEEIVDQDLFSATLDVIQNFMRTSFPGLRGKWLRTIAHGDHTIVMERGRLVYMTVVLEGEETDQLRRQMRDLLLDFESRNRDILANWRGVPAEAVGTDEALGPLIWETETDQALWTDDQRDRGPVGPTRPDD